MPEDNKWEMREWLELLEVCHDWGNSLQQQGTGCAVSAGWKGSWKNRGKESEQEAMATADTWSIVLS